MSLLKSLLVVFGTALFFFGIFSVSLAAETEPDFSFFEDPNNSYQDAPKNATEAEPPCITCAQEPSKTKNQNDLANISKKIQTKPPKTQEPCITCGRVSPAQSAKARRQQLLRGENIWSQFPQIAGYSESPQVKSMINFAQRHARRHSGGQCYRYVKEALCGAKRPQCKNSAMVRGYPNGNPVFADRASNVPRSKRAGVNAIRTFKDQGFINLLEDAQTSALIKNPAAAPKGAILIYAGGKNGGHIEIKTGDGATGSYISDFSAPDSVLQNELGGRASKRYTLLGVMIKPAEKLR